MTTQKNTSADGDEVTNKKKRRKPGDPNVSVQGDNHGSSEPANVSVQNDNHGSSEPAN